MATSARAVYVVNIDGQQYRRPVENPYVLMQKIKKDIRTTFNLDYEFDLYYKGSKILETSSLNENCFDDCTPLVVLRQDECNLPRQTTQPKLIRKVLSLNNLFEEDIEDETESNCKNSSVSIEGYHWKPTTIIYITPARSVDEEINLSVQTSANLPLSSRSKQPSSTESINRTIAGQSHTLLSPPLSTEVQPMYPAGLSVPVNDLRTARQQTIVKFSLPKNTPFIRTRMQEKADSVEGLFELGKYDCHSHFLREHGSILGNNATSGYSSSSSSRSSSPALSNINFIIPTANRDLPKSKGIFSQITISIQTLHDIYSLDLPTNITLRQLHSILKEQFQQNNQCEKYTDRTHTLLVFNSRMHIFKNVDIDNEHVKTFLSLKTTRNNTDDRTPDFFVYALRRKLVETMYVYEQDPVKIFDNSIWWQSHSEVEQTALSQSTLLSTLYVLYQYFRRPPLNEKASRRSLETQFLLYLRKFLFPPAFQALKHLLIREIFAFEKVVLIDGLLKLLSQFCPSSINQDLLGIYTPHLFCWLFERSRDEMEKQDGFLKFDLMRFSHKMNRHYLNDPVTIHDLDHDRNILYESHEAERYKNVTRNVDLFSLIKYLKNSMHPETSDLDTYTIDTWGCHQIQSIDRLNETEMSVLGKTMSRVYRSFTLLIRNALENSDVRDQLILVNNKQVGICFKRQQRINPDGTTDQDLQCFMPADPTHPGIITFNKSDVFEVEHGRPDPRIPTPLRSNLPMQSNSIVSSSPVEQITLILLDISNSMFEKRVEHNTVPKRFIDLSVNILKMICANLHRQSHSHAMGIILFGKDVISHCPITTNADQFEKAIYQIPKYGQPWTSMYDAIDTGFTSIQKYQSTHSTTSNCEKLIICITDGINNRGKLTINDLKQRVRRTPVVIDLIFFSSNTVTPYTLKQKNNIDEFRLFCEKSGGTIYRNASIDPIDLAATFKRETVLWLKARKDRKRFSCGVALSVDCPLAKEPEKLYETAVHPQAHDSYQQSDFMRRLHAEVNGVVRKQIENMQLYITRNKNGQMDYTFWKVIIQGPPNSLYAKGHWLLYVIFSDNYPILPPIVRFHTPIFHLNITADGHISHDLFDISWSTVISMVEIFRAVNQLLMKPDMRNAVSEEYLQLYEQNPSGYESRVHKYCEKHASKKPDELKRSYRLEDT